MTHPVPAWLAEAVIYEVYPQSFSDSNQDGIGDLRGAIEKLDYLQWLGVNVVWFNPCFASPFRDAGYDVSDYCSIAPRYGTNDDMVEFIAEARARGIRVLLDLVAGHTSVEHPWFVASANDPSDDRYVWANRPGDGFVTGPGSRPGWYMKNFFEEQPALNFGYARLDPDEPWRQLPDAPGPRRNRRALQEIIAFWIERGAAGFRVDMAYSLVKDDHDLTATTALWRGIREWLGATYPDAVLVPESDEKGTADAGRRATFDADFALVIHPEHSALFNSGAAGILPWQDDVEPCYFDPDVGPAEGTAALRRFLDLWHARSIGAGEERLQILPSSDHDFSRLACGQRTGNQLRAAFTFLLTWGTIPSIYYGDEIGMRYLPGLPVKEGSMWNPRFNRAGCRTPMQWDPDLPNDGFSAAPADMLYLPQDGAPDRPTVAAQHDHAGSLLRFVRDVIALRRCAPALGVAASRTVLTIGYPFVYVRGGTHLVVVNPRREAATIELDRPVVVTGDPLAGRGVRIAGSSISVEAFGHGIFALASTSPGTGG